MVRRRHLLVSYVLVVVGATTAIWGLTPDLSEPGGTDRLLEPVVSDAVRAALGIVAIVVLLGALGVMYSPAGRRLQRRGDEGVLNPLLAAGSYGAFAYRAGTWLVDGANIGGALLLYGELVVLPVLFCIAALAALRLSSER